MNAYAGRGLHGDVVERIGSRIVRGDVAPGATLFAEALEAELEVSKTVVREALKVLAAKGLVESRQKRGTVVRPRGDWSLLDSDVLRWLASSEPDFPFLESVTEVRGIMEPAGARLAAARRTDEDLAELDEAIEAMIDAGTDPDAAAAADVRFHRAVLFAAHNELLSRMQAVLAGGLHVRDRFVHDGHQAPDAIAMHRALVDAIRAGDAELALKSSEDLIARSSADLAKARREERRRQSARARRSSGAAAKGRATGGGRR